MNNDFSHKFFLEWVEAWNAHDLDKILVHYADDFEMSSPVIQQILNVKTGVLNGKEVVRTYQEKALKLNQNLHFEFINTHIGVNSLVIQHKSHRGLSAEVFFFDDKNKVKSAFAHYG